MGYTRIARVVIGDRVFVGAGAIILPGSRIGDDSIVGAGAVVRGGVPPHSLVFGNPAKVVSDVKSVADWHHKAAMQGPSWPHEGWTVGRGITDARKQAQREALANGISGYLKATPPGPPLNAGEPSEKARRDWGSARLARRRRAKVHLEHLESIPGEVREQLAWRPVQVVATVRVPAVRRRVLSEERDRVMCLVAHDQPVTLRRHGDHPREPREVQLVEIQRGVKA